MVIGTDIYVDVNPVFMQSDQRLRNACVSSNILEKYGGKLWQELDLAVEP